MLRVPARLLEDVVVEAPAGSRWSSTYLDPVTVRAQVETSSAQVVQDDRGVTVVPALELRAGPAWAPWLQPRARVTVAGVQSWIVKVTHVRAGGRTVVVEATTSEQPALWGAGIVVDVVILRGGVDARGNPTAAVEIPVSGAVMVSGSSSDPTTDWAQVPLTKATVHVDGEPIRSTDAVRVDAGLLAGTWDVDGDPQVREPDHYEAQLRRRP